MKIFRPLLWLVVGLVSTTAAAQSITAEHLSAISVEECAAARQVKLTGQLAPSAPWAKRGGTDWRLLRDVCWQVRDVDLSEASAELVPANAFHSRHHLRSIVLPQNVREIGAQAFFACDSLEEIVLPASVERVGQSAFSQCRRLQRVVFEGAPEVADFAFAGCPLLKDIQLKAARPRFSTLAFYDTRSIYEEDLQDLDTLGLEPCLVPQPAVMRMDNGEPLMWTDVKAVQAPKQLANERNILLALITGNTDYNPVENPQASAFVRLALEPTLPDPEAYTLTVDEGGVDIKGGSAAGVFWGIMTLRQLMLDSNGSAYRRHALNACHIEDQPRMHVRELMVDPARTFIPFEELKKLVLIMAQYKFNALHLHLSDDQAWRMEVKKYPLLTQKASFRAGMDDMLQPDPGYYTQKQMKELVAYAERYHVMIIPELEMPGHEVAAIHAYPQLTCGAKEIPMRTICGVSDDLLCPASEFTFKFLTDVLREYRKIFPAPYVHLGGDEAGWPPLSNWTNCSACQNLKRQLGIDPVDRREDNWRLQKHLFDRVIGVLRDELGKTPMYWYEPDFKEIQPGCVTFAWRGGQTNMAIESAQKNGVKVMLCPGDHCYFDYPMVPGDMPEINWGMPVLSLKEAYALDPAWGHDADFERETIFGVAGTLWGESINTPKRITYQLFPRGFALAEAGWSPQSVRQYDDFLRRIHPHMTDLQRRGVSVDLSK